MRLMAVRALSEMFAMRKLLIAVAAGAVFAANPALAQDDPIFDDEPYAEVEDALPPGEEIEEMAPAIDGAAGALLDVDVGPVLDAADPYRRHHWRGRRTLGDLARRDDPYFDARLRDSIYGTTAELGRMMDAIAAATPAMRRSFYEMERAIDRAAQDYRYRRRY
ncbi:MAG TPA: hypothetical protein VLK25_03040 [Allosphingosinicella sp.]|nr:hypothetical protein [Allosphingosinicella sp.]